MQVTLYLASVVGTIAALGCTSTLTEFRCEVAADCGEMDGRCEESGHCSFADDDCLSGFRFGKSSGSESQACVDETPGVDSRDAGFERPIARIENPPPLGCGETSAILDGSGSEAAAGESLTNFAWELILDGDVLDSFDGIPSSTLRADIHRLGGTYESPHINATSYEGRKALNLNLTMATGPGSVSTPVDFDSQEAGGSVPNFTLAFAVGKEDDDGGLGIVALVDGDGLEWPFGQFVIGDGMTEIHLTPGSAGDVPLAPPVQLHIGFFDLGSYWIDNVSLTQPESEEQLVSNSSVEESEYPWLQNSDAPEPEAASYNALPLNLQQPGEYSVRLRVTDSSTAQSDVAEVSLSIRDCPEGSPGF